MGGPAGIAIGVGVGTIVGFGGFLIGKLRLALVLLRVG